MPEDNINKVPAVQDEETLDDIVFANRHKEYGAYQMRKGYRRLLTKSFAIGLIGFFAVVVGPMLFMALSAENKQQKVVSIDLTAIQDTPPPVDNTPAPPPPPEPPKDMPKQEIVKDLIPQPKSNPPVEEPPKTIQQVQNTTTGAINQEGVKSAAYAPPPPPPSSGAGHNVEAPKPTNEIVEHVDQPADYVGGLNKFRNAFSQNFDQSNVDADGDVSAMITFVVERDGSLTQVVATGPNKSFNKECERAVKAVRGRWNPGKVQGQPVRSRFRFPVKMNFSM